MAGSAGVARAGPGTVDRVVASIGNTAITQAEVEAEYRFEMFLDGKLPQGAADAETLARVRDRLIEQKLLAEEAAAEGTEAEDPPPHATELLNEVRGRFGSEEAFEKALRSLGVDREHIVTRMASQEKVLLMIEQRFRPSAWPERAEIEAYYRETFVREFVRHSSAPPPPLNAVENKIREILVQEKINHLLEAWLEEMKSIHRVKVHDF